MNFFFLSLNGRQVAIGIRGRMFEGMAFDSSYNASGIYLSPHVSAPNVYKEEIAQLM